MTKRKPDTYIRSRNNILNRVLSCPVLSPEWWKSTYDPSIGSLVALQSASPSKWYLSWCEEVHRNTEGVPIQYLLRSVEDHELCWWGNVGIWQYTDDWVDLDPSWRWTDRQYEFRDKWNRVLRKNDAWFVLSGPTEFHKNGGVTLSLRQRHNGYRFGDDDPSFRHTKTFEDWRKTTKAMMDEFYRDGVTASNQFKEDAT